MRECHEAKVIHEDDDAIRAYCPLCHTQEVFRKDWRGVPLNRDYIRFFKRDALQGNDSLLYRYHPEWLAL